MQPPLPRQHPYGQPRQPSGPPPYGSGGYYPPPVKRGNGFAIAGILLAIFAPVLGLIFSIIGLVKSKALAGAGKALSIVGIVLSLVVGVAVTTAIVVVGNSTAADPACISAEHDATQMGNTLNADETAISRDASNPSALRTDLQKFQTDMQSLQRQLSGALGQAQHQSVKTRIAALTGDISALDSSLQAIGNGDTSQASQMNTEANKL